MQNSNSSLTAKFVGVQKEFAILQINEFGLAEVGTLWWPLKKMPPEATTGDTLTVSVESRRIGAAPAAPKSTPQIIEQKNDEEKYARMRTLLEELIN